MDASHRFDDPPQDLRQPGTGRRRLLRAAGAGALAASLGPLCATRALAQPAAKKIRLAHPAPIAHGWHLWAERFGKTVAEKSGGKLTCQIFPNAQMGNERDTAQAVRLGSIEMGAIGVGLMNWVPEMSITDAPFLWKNRAQCYKAIAGAFGDDLRKRSLDKGFVLTGWTDLGFRCMTNNKVPINAAKDMQNLKMRVPNSKAYIAMMQATGATTVAVDLSELYLALRQGVADGQDTPPSVVKSNKYYEVQKYVSKTDHILTTAYTVTNPKFFDSLAADERAAFLAACATPTTTCGSTRRRTRRRPTPSSRRRACRSTSSRTSSRSAAACGPVIDKFPELFLPELVKMARATPA